MPPAPHRIPARPAPRRVIVLCGAADVFANGIHLNVIEAADHPAEESWRNIGAIDDLVEAILTTTDRLYGGRVRWQAAPPPPEELMLALAADEVWCRSGAVLNPHYRLMGLHGSEYWTCIRCSRRVGEEKAAELTQACLPVSPASAARCGPGRPRDQQLTSPGYRRAGRRSPWPGNWPAAPTHQSRLAAKARRLAEIAATQPLDSYRQAELAVMSRNFRGPGRAVPATAPGLCLQGEANTNAGLHHGPPPDAR